MVERARPIDGAEGYRLFLRHGGRLELEEINEHLRGVGLRSVQPRMLLHYRKLHRHGYRSYMTQNRLDLSIAGEAAWSDDLRAQYAEVRQPFDAELIQGTKKSPVSVESIGPLSATVMGQKLPTAGTSAVLRLLATGIERLAVVTRSDRASGRAHLAFDVYTSIPIASTDAPYSIRLRFELPADASSMAAVSDLLVRLDLALARVTGDDAELPRVTRVSMASPLEVELTGNAKLDLFITLAAAALLLRERYWKGEQEKLKARGLQLDNEQKRAAARRRADARLSKELDRARSAAEGEVLEVARDAGLEVGEPDSLTRREFLEGVRAMLTLPAEMIATVLKAPNSRSRRRK